MEEKGTRGIVEEASFRDEQNKSRIGWWFYRHSLTTFDGRDQPDQNFIKFYQPHVCIYYK